MGIRDQTVEDVVVRPMFCTATAKEQHEHAIFVFLFIQYKCDNIVEAITC